MLCLLQKSKYDLGLTERKMKVLKSHYILNLICFFSAHSRLPWPFLELSGPPSECGWCWYEESFPRYAMTQSASRNSFSKLKWNQSMRNLMKWNVWSKSHERMKDWVLISPASHEKTFSCWKRRKKREENRNVFPSQVRRLLETEATPPVLPPTPRVEERDWGELEKEWWGQPCQRSKRWSTA